MTGDGRSFLSVIVIDRLNAAKPEDVLARTLAIRRRHLTGFTQTVPERGTIHGVVFARTYWSGIHTYKGSGQTSVQQGYTYATTGLAHAVSLEGYETRNCVGSDCTARPFAATSLPVAEAAILSLRRK